MSALRRVLDREWRANAVERHSGAIRVLAAIFGLATWLDLFLRVIGPALGRAHFPTSAYWVAARLVWDGRGALLFDPPAFTQAAVELGAAPDLAFGVLNAPAGVLLLLPFGLLPEATAYPAWTILSVASLLGAIAVLLSTLRLSATVALIFLAALPLFHPLRSNIAAGQAYAFVLLAVVVAALAYARPLSPLVKGVALSTVALLKLYYGLILLLPPVLERRSKLLWFWAAIVAGAVLLSAMLVGSEGWVVWFQTALTWRSRPETTVTAYQTLNSLFGHLFRYDPTWNLAPALAAPLIADVLWAVSAATLVGISAVAIARHARAIDRPLLVLAVVVPVAILISPIAEDYHYVLALFPLAVAGAALLHDRGIGLGRLFTFVAAAALLAPAWPFNQLVIEGWWAALFYPRVYGAFLLWALLVYLAWLRPPSTA